MSCTCQKCKKQYKVDVIIPDGLWEKIKPIGSSNGGGAICGSCIMESIESFDRYGMFELNPDPNKDTSRMEEWGKGFARNEKIRHTLSVEINCE